jgi:hypothetical protein
MKDLLPLLSHFPKSIEYWLGEGWVKKDDRKQNTLVPLLFPLQNSNPSLLIIHEQKSTAVLVCFEKMVYRDPDMCAKLNSKTHLCCRFLFYPLVTKYGFIVPFYYFYLMPEIYSFKISSFLYLS